MIGLHKTPYPEIEPLRLDYLASLPEFQELYLEWMVAKSDGYLIRVQDQIAGHAVLTSEGILVEFFLYDPYISIASRCFQTVISQLPVKSVYCLSFHSVLLNCCLEHSFSHKLIGTSFRNFLPTRSYTSNELTITVAQTSDIPFLLKQEDGLYESPEELDFLVSNKNLLLFKKDHQLIGCGFLIRVHPNWNYYDIGMWVHPDYRRQGFATQIICWLKEECIRNQWIPICGCAIDNAASQKTLEKNGFVGKYKLIEFQVR